MIKESVDTTIAPFDMGVELPEEGVWVQQGLNNLVRTLANGEWFIKTFPSEASCLKNYLWYIQDGSFPYVTVMPKLVSIGDIRAQIGVPLMGRNWQTGKISPSINVGIAIHDDSGEKVLEYRHLISEPELRK